MVTPPFDWTYYPAHLAPEALSVVWCHFPLIEAPETPPPKARPALVRRTLRKDDKVSLEVTYGTSNPERYSGRDLYVANLNDMIDAGLPQATLFLLDRTIILPWAAEWFSKRDDGTGPIIGYLNSRSQEYLRHILDWGRR